MSIESEITRITNEVSSQKDLIALISGVLEGTTVPGMLAEIEVGIFEPTENCLLTTQIPFSRTHNRPPSMVVIGDITPTNNQSTNGLLYAYITDVVSVIGSHIMQDNTHQPIIGVNGQQLKSSETNRTDQHSAFADGTFNELVRSTSFNVARLENTSRQYIAGRRYKWVGIWMPQEA